VYYTGMIIAEIKTSAWYKRNYF